MICNFSLYYHKSHGLFYELSYLKEYESNIISGEMNLSNNSKLYK